jgi:4-amino-4-deoxy-L-arabinose transferase-like glycosyltransferase
MNPGGTALTATVTTTNLDDDRVRLRPVPTGASSPRLRRIAWAPTLRWVVPLLVVSLVAAAHLVNMFHAPALFDDEGTYDSEAWALLHHGTLSHYTYWYDHPPLGWMTLAGWFLVTLAYPLHLDLFNAGRIMMLGCTVASAGLLYVLVRRLHARAWAAGLAVLLFGLTPLGMVWQRETLLDNMATPLLIAAFALSLSPRQRLVAAVGATAALALAILMKETSALYAPFVIWQLWQTTAAPRRRITMCLAGTIGVLILALYPTYALIKGEFFPGRNHVSLTWALWWQLAERKGGGSAVTSHSATQLAVLSWLHADWPLLACALGCSIFVLITIRIGRPVAAAMLLLAVLPLRSGYLPAPYIIGVLWPAAAVIGIAVDRLVAARAGRRRIYTRPRRAQVVRGISVATSTSVVVLAAVLALGRDVRMDKASWTSNPVGTQRAAYRWVASNLPPGSVVVVDNSAWLYLVDHGFPEQTTLWSPKVDLDPAVRDRLQAGWRSIRYIVDSPVLRDTVAQSPIVREALAHGEVIATFGVGADNEIQILRIAENPGS